MSEAANLAIHAMGYLASVEPTTAVSTSLVAKQLEASEAHLSKVFQRLNKAGLVKSIRGPKGGFILAKAPHRISLLEIYQVIDGVLKNDTCVLGRKKCEYEACVFGTLITDVQKQFKDHFSNTTLADIG